MWFGGEVPTFEGSTLVCNVGACLLTVTRHHIPEHHNVKDFISFINIYHTLITSCITTNFRIIF
jgi:multisubunit Na+/H+ antiporter MnhE subunit